MAFGTGNGGFQGFGTANNSNTFGSGGGFGSNTNSGGGFGSNTNTNTSFGSKPFASGGGLFGGGASTSGSTFGGGFGATANNTSTGFGGGNTSGSLFGQTKTGFGTSNTGSTTLFGGQSNSGFGAANTTGGFGNSAPGGFGVGATANAPNNGTASTPFNAFVEKDNSGSQHFQTITFQAPYQHYSLEELRLVDYNQGRRYGNQNGQAGAFGQSTGFGGFGQPNTNTNTGFGANTNTSGSLFGNTGTTNSPFGQSNTTAFGGNTNTTGGGLFGQNKPGGMFGSTATTQPASGGLFGTANTSNTGGAFGSGAFGSSNTGGGMFGQQNQSQNKPFGFGGNTNTAATSNPFGSTNTTTFGQSGNTSGGLFGQQNQTSAAPAFGSSTQQTGNTGGGLFGGGAFGSTPQNQTQNQPSGGLFGGFGQNQQNQQKPSLFGNTANTGATGGLFGQSNQNQQQGGLFSSTNANQNQGSSLFGQKPAAAGSSLFGSAPANTGSTGGGLFGSLNTQNTQQNTGGSLFGGQNQQKPGGLFGGSTNNATGGGGLFGSLGQGNTNTSGLGGSLFGGQNQQQQPQQSTMNNSLFGASGNSLLQTSMNTNPYGNDALFAGLSTPTQSPGPLATPLSSSQKTRKSAILPQHKLNPSASTRLLTPQRKIGGGGFGFSYSTYGTPNSASSNSSPGFSSNYLGGGSLSRSLGKSLSTSNLRNSFTPETSILAPGAFSTNGRSFAGGSLKKLNINRSINTRVPLFDDPTPETRKRVSFAGATNGSSELSNGTANGTEANSSMTGQLILREEPETISSAEGSTSQLSSTPTLNGDAPNGVSSRPEMLQQINGNELTPVPENGALTQRTSSSLNAQTGSKSADPSPGAYYSSPSLNELKKMSRKQLESVPNFVVGRQNIGRIEFNQGQPVDLSGVDLDKLFGDIVQLTARNATVYGETASVPKPALGTGLNKPSRIVLGNSWPRGYHRSKRDPDKLKCQKHIERLKRVAGTNYEQYVKETGEWIFTVPHFSSYGLNYDDYTDDDDEDEEMESSELSPAPDTPAPAQLHSSQLTGTPQEDSFVSPTQSSPDDTFDFKKGKRKRASVPGGYGDEVAYEEEDEVDESMNTNGESFLGERSVGSLDGQHDTDYSSESESESVEDQDMAGSVSGPVQTTEQPTARESDPFKDSIKPKSILKPSQPQRSVFGTPSKGQLVFDDDWANQLQRTISPKKQDRQALRESQGAVLRECEGNVGNLAKSLNGQTIATSIDLMNSLFGEMDKQSKAPLKRIGHGIELPYPKRPKTSHDLDELSQYDRDFHSCNKPHFSGVGQLTYANKGLHSLEGGIYPTTQEPLIGAHKDIRFTKLPTFPDAAPATLDTQKEHSQVMDMDGVPSAKIHYSEPCLDFEDLVKSVSIDTPAGIHEHKAWRLLTLLFDDNFEVPSDMTREQFETHKERYRKDQLAQFWEALVFPDMNAHVEEAKTPEEKAIAYLSGHNIADACHALLNGFNLRLATMVSQIGGDEVMRRDMTTQIEEWRRLDMLSEMEDSIRALYELVAGNCGRAEGKIGGGRENKAATFNIAGRFGLDWRRAFGLRLWYGILADEPIELAVAQFADALREGREDVKPVPWFVEQGVDMGWHDPEAEDREDILWGILKLYASSKMELPANVEDVLAPQNVSGNPLNARLSFQLFQIFKSRLDDQDELDTRKVGMPTVREGNGLRKSFLSSTASSAEKDVQSQNALAELGDNLALTYAASLHTPEHWTTALFVYEHLSSPAMREHYIRSLLAQYSNTYSLVEFDTTYKYLQQELRVPVTWMHAAAALQAKTEGDNVRQVVHLVKAGELDEAHEVLCRSVGPESIISRDYDALRELLGDFVPTPVNSPLDDGASMASSVRSRAHKKEPVQGWNLGGQIYFDYIHLLDLTNNQSSYRVDEDLIQDICDLLSKLQHALEIVARDKLTSCGLEERVALTEISGVVASLVAKNKADRARVLKLPLAEDIWLRHTQDLSVGYYRAVMAGGR
ncbi:uncharacterized protein BDR25DRAFT_303231 [Lindgomyces ingoldianus]|uniref:Uncharacterized protein n=1 Tax=Lindgomyces ingoldianus TaxID=673940 RepID=A0ACB6QY71_9PLEO|nr:uncharacterized protein BDR25DRAFT_303231 [Lindgomyces ingoldianus]KAF2471836.1 hypothetical protein BDR25DRAFT_303231 [Lindgomyces ingoldianus]